MKITIPYLTLDGHTEEHAIIITDETKILCLCKHEEGSWLNNKWEGKGYYKYGVTLITDKTYSISKETFEMLEEKLYGK